MTGRDLENLPRIDIVPMGRVTRVPDWPGGGSGEIFDVHCFVIHHPGESAVALGAAFSSAEVLDS